MVHTGYDDTMRTACMLLHGAFISTDAANVTLRGISNTTSDYIKEMIVESRATGDAEYVDAADRIRDFAVSTNVLTDRTTTILEDIMAVMENQCRGYVRAVSPR